MAARCEAIPAFKKLQMKFGGYRMRYAWVSQRGYYPDEMEKANQDAHVEVENFMADEGAEDLHLFGVFDGHGKTGDHCAGYVRDQLPGLLKAKCKEHPQDFEKAYKEAFIQVNEGLHKSSIDDSLSGTTAIVVLFEGGTIHVANVGDSRAIIAQQRDDHLVAYSLSRDQTPFRKDERERCKRAGARVASMDQLEGLVPMGDDQFGDEDNAGGEEGDGDPPRIWLAEQMTPGCAFTRSIGDAVGERVGVYAEPELLNKNLTADDKYIIIASDGVWEFLTNQAVVNMVDSFKSPLKACKAVVQESYKLWLQYDVRTDDITMIALYLEEMDGVTNAFLEEEKKLAKEGAAADAGGDPRRNSLAANLRRQSVSRKGSAGGWDAIRRVSAVGISLGKSVVEGEQQRPVRRVMTKEKRQVVTSASAEDGSFNASGKPEEGWGFKVLGKVSGEKEVEEIRAAVATNFLLSHLNAAQQKEVFSAMERCETKAKDVVIEKGQPGDWFYVVHSGAYDVVIEGNVVFSYSVDEGGGSNPSFGELALLYSKPRAASIVTSAAGKLWRLHRSTFSEIVMRSSSQKLIKTLRSVEVLKFLSISQLQRLQDALSEVTVEAGKKVITQGEPGKEFYVIMEGKAKVTISSPDAPKGREVMQLDVYDYFGERALLNDAARAATVTSTTKMKLLYISKTLFEEVLGSLEAIIDQHRRQREEQAKRAYVQRQAEGLLEVTEAEFKPVAKVGTSACGDFFLVSRLADGSPEGQRDSLSEASVASGGRESEQRFTIHVVSKKKTVDAKMQKAVMREVALVGALPPCPFVPILLAAFSDKSRLFAVLGTVLACELSAIVGKEKLDEESAKFYVACLSRALNHLHDQEIVCRTCTLDTVSLDSRGFPQLADFSLSKNVSDGGGRTYTLCGTPDYLAPEQITKAGHGFEVDFWSLGVLAFELLTAVSPWDPKETGMSEMKKYSAITSFQPKRGSTAEGAGALPYPSHVSKEARSIIEDFMCPDPAARLGCRGAGQEDIQLDPWLSSVTWDTLETSDPPHKPECADLVTKYYATPDGERPSFEAPNYHGSNQWCDDWDFTCTVGYTVANARGEDGDGRKRSLTKGSL